jgi:hypothetical protein
MVRHMAPTAGLFPLLCRKLKALLHVASMTLRIPSIDIIPWANACISIYGVFEVVQILCECMRAGLEHVDVQVTQHTSVENKYHQFIDLEITGETVRLQHGFVQELW